MKKPLLLNSPRPQFFMQEKSDPAAYVGEAERGAFFVRGPRSKLVRMTNAGAVNEENTITPYDGSAITIDGHYALRRPSWSHNSRLPPTAEEIAAQKAALAAPWSYVDVRTGTSSWSLSFEDNDAVARNFAGADDENLYFVIRGETVAIARSDGATRWKRAASESVAPLPEELADLVMRPSLAADGAKVVIVADVAFGKMDAPALIYRPTPEIGWLFCALEAGEGQQPWDRPAIAHFRDGWVTVVWGRRIYRVPTDYVPTDGRLEGLCVAWHPDGTISSPIAETFGTVWARDDVESEAKTREAERLRRVEENLEPLVEAGLLPPLAMLDLSEVEADDVDPLPLLCEVFGPTGGIAHGFLFHDWRFGQETDDVIAEFVACLPEPLDLTQIDVMDDILRVRFEGEEDSIDVHTDNLNAVASYVNGKLEDKGRAERVHGIETDGDFFAFLVRRPDALPALEELGLAFYDP